MTSSNKKGDDYFHCPDCDMRVHENDRENHLNGARHKYRTRQKTSVATQIGPRFYCDTCETEFTDVHFYTIHQGSKTHRRNLKRLEKNVKGAQNTSSLATSSVAKKTRPAAASRRGSIQVTEGFREGANVAKKIRPIARRVPIEGFDTYMTIDDFKDVCDYKSVREKYRTRNNRNPEGNNKAYICSVTAYWAVSLALDTSVQDFKISLNDKEWGDFGDVVVEIELKETKQQLSTTMSFAIQFKDISNNVRSIDSLAEGKFSFAKYLTQIRLLKQRKEIDNKKFVIFTTAQAEANMVKQIKLKSDILHGTKHACNYCKDEEKEISVVAKTLSNRRKLLINTSDDNDSIFFFFCTDNVHVPPTIYLYTHQKKQKHFSSWIDDLVCASLDGDRKVDIHREFIRFVEYWSDGYLGGSYRLKKEDVLVKLGHIMLYSFKIPPIVRTTERRSYIIWQQAISSVDITILKKNPMIISKICEPLNSKIETELKLKIDTTTSTISLDQTIIRNIQNPVLKMYLFEETMGDIQYDVPLELVYDFFWKAGLIPLLLKVENLKDQEHILNIVNLLKSLGLTRRYFLITSDQNIKTSLRYYSRTLDFFVNADDIANKIPSFLLDNVKINVTEDFSLSLRRIQDSDMFFLKTVDAYEFFDMSLGKYSFKSLGNNLARNDGQDTQLVLGDEMMSRLKGEVESKNEMKMVLLKYENNEQGNFLRGVKPNLFHK